MKRIFIAIQVDLNKELLDAVNKLKNVLRDEAVKWVEETNRHVTLRFLGETGEDRIQDIKQAINNSVSLFDQFTLMLSGMDFFSGRDQVKAFFLRINRSPELDALKKTLDDELHGAGFERENRMFNPHLTLGRVKRLTHVETFKRQISVSGSLKQVIPVKEIILYESILSPKGPMYRSLMKSVLK